MNDINDTIKTLPTNLKEWLLRNRGESLSYGDLMNIDNDINIDESILSSEEQRIKDNIIQSDKNRLQKFGLYNEL